MVVDHSLKENCKQCVSRSSPIYGFSFRFTAMIYSHSRKQINHHAPKQETNLRFLGIVKSWLVAASGLVTL